MKLWNMVSELKSSTYKWIELSRLVSEETVHHPLFPDMGRTQILNLSTDGAASQCYSLASQYGTHIDPPAHFVEGGRPLHEISAKEMLYPLCVIDVSERFQENPDYELTPDDIAEWEEKNGTIPQGAFVAMHTGWKPETAVDSSGEEHYPGWGVPALQVLVTRGVGCIGHEPADTDPAANVKKTGWAAESYWLSQDKIQIELMVNLEQLPETGGLILCTFPRIKDGTGFTARCVAIVEV